MHRRHFLLTSLAGAVCAPLAAAAQPPAKIPRIGYLGPTSSSAGARLLESFRQGLHELGYVEGQNIFVDYRWAEGMPGRLPTLAAELIQLRVDAIVTYNNAAVAALQQATRTIPIVVANMGDPVGSGLVTSLARPGGNITGFSGLAEQLSGKWVALLREAEPKVSRVAVLAVSQTPAHRTMWIEVQGAAKALTMTSQRQEVAGPDEIEHALASLVKGRAQALIVLPHAVTNARRAQIVGLAAKHRLPGMYPDGQYVEAGGLMSYAANFSDLHRRAATFVDKILKGARPADLPVEQPTKFELVINLKTAKALGLTIPQALLLRADQVIE
jgi:putative tryptophan/tyrosine transport system substrate-binding protein